MSVVRSLVMGLLCLCLSMTALAQQLKLGKLPASMTKSAILELSGDNQGLLMVRISDTASINTLSPPDGMMIYHTPTKSLLLRANGYWQQVSSGKFTPANWQLAGNAGTNSSTDFIGTTDDKPLIFKSFNTPYIEMGRRQTLGLTQGYTDYDNVDESVIHLKSAVQFYAPAASFYKPKIFVDTYGNFRTKGSSAGTDYFEFGATGTSNNGGFEFIIGDDGDEPIVFKSYNYLTGMSEMMRLQSGRMAVGSNAFNATAPEKLLIDAGVTTSYNLMTGKGSIDNYLQINVQNRSNGGNASSDLVATADNGDESVNYIDMGINSSAFSNVTYPMISGANNGYLYTTGNDFSIGNGTAAKSLRFFTGGFALTNERLRIDGTGNVGVGTTAPSTKLHVKSGTSNDSGLRLENLTNASSTTSGAAVIGVDATGKVVRTKTPTYYSGTGTTASTETVTKIWVAEVANVTGGVQTITIPANVGFSTILSIQATAKGGSSVATAPIAIVTSNTTSSVTIRVLESKATTIVIGGTAEGLEVHDNTATTIYLRVEGN